MVYDWIQTNEDLKARHIRKMQFGNDAVDLLSSAYSQPSFCIAGFKNGIAF